MDMNGWRGLRLKHFGVQIWEQQGRQEQPKVFQTCDKTLIHEGWRMDLGNSNTTPTIYFWGNVSRHTLGREGGLGCRRPNGGPALVPNQTSSANTRLYWHSNHLSLCYRRTKCVTTEIRY